MSGGFVGKFAGKFGLGKNEAKFGFGGLKWIGTGGTREGPGIPKLYNLFGLGICLGLCFTRRLGT